MTAIEHGSGGYWGRTLGSTAWFLVSLTAGVLAARALGRSDVVGMAIGLGLLLGTHAVAFYFGAYKRLWWLNDWRIGLSVSLGCVGIILGGAN